MIQKSTWLMSTIINAWDIHKRGGKPEMANVLKILVMLQQAAQKDLEDTNMKYL